MNILPQQLADYDVLISLKPKVTAQSLAGVSRLCAIGRCGVGYDNVDLEACTEHGIAVFITPGGVVRPVAESIVLLVLALSHHLLRKDRQVRRGLWAESTRPLGREPRQRVVGTIGLGNIATEAIRLLRVFDVSRFLAFDPYVSPDRAAQLGVEAVSLEDLLRQSDYVLVNCPLTPQTRGLLGKPQFALMKPDAVLINTARGPIVDESALIEALQNGRIAGAALDVFEKEPLSSRLAPGGDGECHPDFTFHRLDRGAVSRYGAHRLPGRFGNLSRRGAGACSESQGAEQSRLSTKTRKV